jgi:type IV secretion system protein VirD4
MASITHGSARFATYKEVKCAGLFGDEGIVLGTLGRHYVRHAGEQHVALVGSTRSGKGVGVIIPTLLTWPGSVICTDVKGGENHLITARYRAQFSRVFAFNPCSRESDKLDPLAEVRLGVHEVGDAQVIAGILVDPDSASRKLDHWEQTAFGLLTGLILHTLYGPRPNKTLPGVLELVDDPQLGMEGVLHEMLTYPHLNEKTVGARMIHPELQDQPHPAIAMIARAQLNRAEREASSVWSTVERCLNLFHDPIIAGNLSRHDLPFHEIHDPDAPVSLYLICNPGDGPRLEPLFKLIIQQVMARLTAGSPRARGPQALAVFEEFPALGYMPFFAKVLGLMGSYRIRALLAMQSLNSLEQIYGERQTILDNCSVKVFMQVGDDRTAQRLVNMLSTTTVEREVQSTSRQAGSLYSNQSWAPHETSRSLLTVGEVIQFPSDREIVMVSGQPPGLDVPPMVLHKLRYFEDRQLRRRAS